MSAYTRPDSKYWYIYLEPIGKKEKTDILIGATRQEKADGRIRARAAYIARMKAISDGTSGIGPRPARTFADHARFYLEHITPEHKGHVREAWILERLIAYFGEKVLLTQLDLEAVKKWRHWRLTTKTVIDHFGGPKGPRRVFPPPGRRTLHREETVLRQVLQEAVPKYLAASPLADVEKPKFVKPKKRNITPDEEARLLDAIRDPADRVIWLIGLDSLIRLGGILGLEKADDKGTYFAVRDSKGGAYTPPISPRLRAALDALPSTAGPHLFPHRRTCDRMEDNVHAFTRMIGRAAARAGVPWGKKADGTTFHWATRRTGATRYLETIGEKGIATVTAMGGWTTPRMLLEEYNEVTQEAMQRVAATRTAPATKVTA
jgi:hypothetical protein